VIASSAMGQEAMGFGDVTLMGMIGAFVGWQVAIIAFPIAPMTAILIVLVQYGLTRNRVVAFGPYLCAGTIVTIFSWPYLWNNFGVIAFELGPIFPIILITLLLMMGAMLTIWRWIKQRVFGYG
jgi:prepilin signal peptidase PulO-like enzyme (type II secretory pathway)